MDWGQVWGVPYRHPMTAGKGFSKSHDLCLEKAGTKELVEICLLLARNQQLEANSCVFTDSYSNAEPHSHMQYPDDGVHLNCMQIY